LSSRQQSNVSFQVNDRFGLSFAELARANYLAMFASGELTDDIGDGSVHFVTDTIDPAPGSP
jgi:hypothetical protein